MATETKSEYTLTKILAGVVLALAVVALTLVAILQPDQLLALAGVLVPVAMGALAILGGMYSISRGNAKSGGPPVVLVLVLVLGVSGCAMTPAQRLATVATSVNALHASAAPAWSSVCKGKAEKCVTDGVASSKDCGPWVACQSALKRYYEAHLVMQRGIQTAAWHLINDNMEAAQRVLATVTAGLAAAYELAKAEGAIQ